MKKLIILDLDNTLFDSTSFRTKLFQKIGKTLGRGTEVEKIVLLCQGIYESLIGEFGLFDPDIFLEKLLLKIRKQNKREEIMKLIFDSKSLKTHLHQDVMSTLTTLSSVGEIGIFSQGEARLQQAKLAPLVHLLRSDRIHITRDKKSQMSKIFKSYKGYKIFFIDDMLPMLHQAKKIKSDIVTIWLKRGRYAQKQKPIFGFEPDAEVTDLRKIVKIITNPARAKICDKPIE